MVDPDRNALVGAVDVGGTKIAVGLVDASGQVHAQEVAPTDRTRDFSYGLGQIAEMLDSCKSQCPGEQLCGIGVGCTGPVDPRTGVLGPNSFLPLWEGVNTIDLMEKRFGLPVAIENDADAAALGEYAWGAGAGASRCIYVTVSTGIGCGVVIDGRLYRGAGGAHPELGHITLDPQRGTTCYCGGRGCWESLASGTALGAWYSAELLERGLPAEVVDARLVCQRAGEGDALAREAVVREGYYLGLGMASLVNAFVPDVIVMGGGVMQSWPLFQAQVQAIIQQNCGLVPHQLTHLRLAALGARTGLAGAARVWFHRFG